MYEEYYGLTEQPFSILPDASYLYLSKRHKTALTLLRYSLLSRQGFTVITGEVGCGKTTLVNQLLSDIDDDITVGLINFTGSEYEDLAEWIMMAYGLDYRGKSKAELYDDFVQFLIREYAQGRRTVLVIDEAQNLQSQGLENVRMLSNVNAQKDYLLHLILVGQPEMRDTMKKPEMRQLMQRVSVAYHLGRLAKDEVRDYIQHRFRYAGGDPGLFHDDAIAMIAEVSEGVPRLINTLCDMALVYGFSQDEPEILPSTIEAVIADRTEMGLMTGEQAAELETKATSSVPDNIIGAGFSSSSR